MNPAKLDCRVEIGQNKSIKNPETKLNEMVWVPFHSCWAERYEPAGRALFEAAVSHLENEVFFNIRPKDGITPGMLLKYKGEEYKIGPVRYGTRKKNLTSLQCRRVD
ncbi:phage head closure protein [Peribacillus frigoritolerans]|uniref:phage head closure protein n=1 Tax=Peribacillus frigoritolerans TaxID=450367 RepID=UPI003D27CECC